MALPGIGVAPAAGGIFNELTAVTRRAFVPKLFVQMYFASPSLFYLMGNAQKAAGGMNQITIPMQGQSMVQGGWTGYGGGFNAPNIIPGIQNGQWNMAYWVVPIPIPFGETVIQSTERVVPILKARMNDAYAVTKQQMASALYTNNSANPQMPDSFIGAFDNGTNVPTYGGINRLTQGNQNFQGNYVNLAASPWSLSSSGFTRAKMASWLTYITNQAGGEAPTYVVMNPADWAKLNEDFIGVERAFVDPGKTYAGMNTSISSSFPNLNVNGVPIFADYFVPVSNVFAVNTKYTSMYLSEDAAFDFSGFYSLVPLNQIGQQGVVVIGYDLVSAKSKSGAWGYGLGGAAF